LAIRKAKSKNQIQQDAEVSVQDTTVIIQGQDIRLVTGHAESGKMKIEDLNLKIGDKLPFNVVEDIVVYMKNDPDFYRKEVFPNLGGVQEAVLSGGKFNKKNLLPMIEKACESYVQKFDIPKRPADLLSREEKMEAIGILLKGEADAFRNKEY